MTDSNSMPSGDGVPSASRPLSTNQPNPEPRSHRSSHVSEDIHLAHYYHSMNWLDEVDATLQESEIVWGETVHPWGRFWARGFDFTLYQAFVAAASVPVYMWCIQNQMSQTVADMVVLVAVFGGLWTLMETASLIVFGTTPGKWLFGIRLRNRDGEKPTLAEALDRTLMVWVQGTALYIPGLSLMVQAWWGKHLQRNGRLPWDVSTHMRVEHQAVPWWRWAFGIFTVIFFVAMLFTLNVMSTTG